MNRLRGKRANFVVKVDLVKAYDMFSWGFHKVLKEFGFIYKLIQIIMFSISSNTMSIRWNGQDSNSFQPKKNLRQGDFICGTLFDME